MKNQTRKSRDIVYLPNPGKSAYLQKKKSAFKLRKTLSVLISDRKAAEAEASPGGPRI